MKHLYFYLTIFMALLILWACENATERVSTTASYRVSVIPVDNKVNAPPLQSFVLGKHPKNDEWLIFGGRTTLDSGGIHNMMACDYSYTAFPASSFNRTLYVYNVKQDSTWKIPLGVIQDSLKKYSKLKKLVNAFLGVDSLFVNSNALSTQENEYLYVVGGYGPAPDNGKVTQDSIRYHYKTFNQVMRIQVPNLIRLIKFLASPKKKPKEVKSLIVQISKSGLVWIGRDPQGLLVSTGGELFKIGNTFYMAGGHNYWEKDAVPTRLSRIKGCDSVRHLCKQVKTTFQQTYVNAVYPFTLGNIKPLKPTLSVTVKTPISDINPDSLKMAMTNDTVMKIIDSTSIFRRRDAPIVSSLNWVNNTPQPGITFYAGVFKYFGFNPKKNAKRPETTFPLPWSNALYIQPESKNQPYVYDTDYNQQNHNVYSCPHFVGLDQDTLHTFLLGGIGGGGSAKSAANTAMGFTNQGLHIRRNIQDNKSPYKVLKNVFTGQEGLYGAEAVLVLNNGVKLYTTPDSTHTKVIDLAKIFANTTSVELGYIYGGIKAIVNNPAGKVYNASCKDSLQTGYGKKYSIPTHQIWKVVFDKK